MQTDCQNWVQTKIDTWVNSVHALPEAAKPQPQASFIADTKSLQAEWTFIQRVIPNIDDLFQPLRTAVANTSPLWFFNL